MIRRALVAGVAVVAALATTPSGGATLGPTNDPLSRHQWGLEAIRAPAAWHYSTGRDVLVAVVDSGINYRHEDLRYKIARIRGLRTVCIPSRGNCRWSDHGDYGPDSHGSGVAGVIAASTNNRRGIAGVAPSSKIIVISGVQNATERWVAKGIRYAVDRGARVVNMSFTHHYPHTGVPEIQAQFETRLGGPLIRSALRYAWSKGAVLVAGAANNGTPYCPDPAINDHVLCVGAVDRRNQRAPYSNFGLGLDLVAPGGIHSGIIERCYGPITTASPEEMIITPVRSRETSVCGSRGYYRVYGTSFAAPHVSGVAALLVARGLTNRQVVSCLQRTTTDLGAPGYDPVYGYGLVNAYRAVRECRR